MPRTTATSSPGEPAPAAARRRALAELGGGPFDLLVIGGGITGAGTARDAAMRGLRVALVERDDFAGGTSSRSSRLVHGGVRYLEHGHLGLVFEASRERRVLLRTAPHLVRPLAFTWPVYRGARVKRWQLEAALTLYDALALFRNVALHRPLGRDAVLAREPALAQAGLTGGAVYYDASTDDARLTLANALAARDAGAVVVNHAAVRALALGGAGGPRAVVADALGGADVEVRARVVVNAAGPWGDAVRRLVDPAAPPGILGAKGVHVAVPAERVGNRGALTLLSPADGRVMFTLPGGRFTILGTTETPAERGPDEVRATEADVDYLLRSVDAFFPVARLRREDVVSAWAGVRPLALPPGRATAAAGTSAASREHRIDVDPRGIVTVSGGKLTTYRAMAAHIVDAAATLLRAPICPRSGTDATPLPGGEIDSADAETGRAADEIGDADVARRLVLAHGGRWRDVWALTRDEPSLASRIAPPLSYVAAEYVYAVERELAFTLADLLVRRTPVAFETRDAGRDAARAVAEIVALRLGWDDAAIARELAAYDREAARLFAVD